MKADRGWNRAFEDPIPLARGRQLVTLQDVASYVMKLPKVEQNIRGSDQDFSYGTKRTLPIFLRSWTKWCACGASANGKVRATFGLMAPCVHKFNS